HRDRYNRVADLGFVDEHLPWDIIVERRQHDFNLCRWVDDVSGWCRLGRRNQVHAKYKLRLTNIFAAQWFSRTYRAFCRGLAVSLPFDRSKPRRPPNCRISGLVCWNSLLCEPT